MKKLNYFFSLFKSKKESVIVLEWRKDFAYVIKEGEPIGHVSFYVTDEETKVKIINVLKLIR
jgi:hypothetical protein